MLITIDKWEWLINGGQPLKSLKFIITILVLDLSSSSEMINQILIMLFCWQSSVACNSCNNLAYFFL